MVVSREMRTVGYLVRCPKENEPLFELMPEEEALALEAQWKAEDEALYRKELEESMHSPSAPTN